MTPEQEEIQQRIERKLKAIEKSFMRLEIFEEFLGGALRNTKRIQKELKADFNCIEEIRGNL